MEWRTSLWWVLDVMVDDHVIAMVHQVAKWKFDYVVQVQPKPKRKAKAKAHPNAPIAKRPRLKLRAGAKAQAVPLANALPGMPPEIPPLAPPDELPVIPLGAPPIIPPVLPPASPEPEVLPPAVPAVAPVAHGQAPPAIHRELGGGPGPGGPRVRLPDTFDWGSGKAKFTFTRRSGESAGWQVRCHYHEKQVSLRSSSGKLLDCSRELSCRACGHSSDEVVRILKLWAVSCELAEDRTAHMAPAQFPRVPGDIASLLSDIELESMLCEVQHRVS